MADAAFDGDVFDADVFDALELLWDIVPQEVETWTVVPNQTPFEERGP